MRILIVDDEEDIRLLARMSLELMAGWEVLTAGSGEEAVRVAARERPDVILMDVMMPDLDGPATFALLRSQPATASTPVILLTAKARPSDRERFLALGVRGLIAKPLDPMTLPAEVRSLLSPGG